MSHVTPRPHLGRGLLVRSSAYRQQTLTSVLWHSGKVAAR